MAFPANYNFNYYRGDTLQFTITPKDTDGNAFSLTGYTAEFKVATARGSGATQYSGTTSINTTTNTVTCTLSGSTGRNLVGGNTYVYDVQITNGTLIYTLLTGNISSTDDIVGAV